MSWVKSWIYEGESKVREEQVVEQDRANSLSADSKSSKSSKPAEHICLADRLNKGSGKWLADESFWWCIIPPFHAQTKSSKTEESDDKGSGALVTNVSSGEEQWCLVSLGNTCVRRLRANGPVYVSLLHLTLPDRVMAALAIKTFKWWECFR